MGLAKLLYGNALRRGYRPETGPERVSLTLLGRCAEGVARGRARRFRNRSGPTVDAKRERQFHGCAPVRQIKASQPSCDRRSGARAASFVSLCDGSDRGADPPASGRRRHLLERSGALQHLADAPGAGRQEGRCGRQRHAARVLHHHRDRRHRHGPPGHEVVAGVARGHRRLGRAHHARPCL